MKRNTKVGERDALLVDAADAIDVALCSGKAAGLATLQRAGFAVPDTVCLTTECYRHWLEVSGLGPLLAGDVQDAALRPSDRSSVLA